MTNGRRAVITGMGVTTSLGFSVSDFWDALLACRSGIRRITSFDPSEYRSQIAGEITDFDANAFLEPKLTVRLDRFAQLALAATKEAVEMSGVDFSREVAQRCGAIVGTGIGGLLEIETQHKRLLERGPRRVSPLMIPKLMANAAAAQVSILYGIKGPNASTVTACASAANAIADAADLIRRGEVDVMISGGAEAAITPLGLAGFCAQKALSTRNDEPERASRPFDADRDGFIIGEGAGIVVLEELEHARRRDARIYAEFLGSGASADAYNIVAPDPSGTGAVIAMKNALDDAGLNPTDVDYVNAHGTSTVLGDEMEALAIRQLFGNHADKLPVSATKSMTGHLLGASAAVEAVATIMAVDKNVIHPTANYETPDPKCNLDCVPGAPREAVVNAAISNSFGFGGHNVTLAFGKFTG
ncbi:MAG TPA: beta-ketoacyl-ACP synthase II [Planctomycetota bacterium]|nr:beta-ketoacyl-ACP synthase II [Planctomycetota bacterium]